MLRRGREGEQRERGRGVKKGEGRVPGVRGPDSHTDLQGLGRGPRVCGVGVRVMVGRGSGAALGRGVGCGKEPCQCPAPQLLRPCSHHQESRKMAMVLSRAHSGLYSEDLEAAASNLVLGGKGGGGPGLPGLGGGGNQWGQNPLS